MQIWKTLCLNPLQSAKGPAMSVTIHCAVLTLLFLAGANPNVQQTVQSTIGRIGLIDPYIPPAGHGGGGRGDHSVLPASKGRLPEDRAASIHAANGSGARTWIRRLPMEPTLVISADVKLPQVDMLALGDPFGKNGPPSNGTGQGGGIGDGDRDRRWKWERSGRWSR